MARRRQSMVHDAVIPNAWPLVLEPCPAYLEGRLEEGTYASPKLCCVVLLTSGLPLETPLRRWMNCGWFQAVSQAPRNTALASLKRKKIQRCISHEKNYSYDRNRQNIKMPPQRITAIIYLHWKVNKIWNLWPNYFFAVFANYSFAMALWLFCVFNCKILFCLPISSSFCCNRS